MVGGEKTYSDSISINQDGILGDCAASKGKEVKSILHYAIEQG